LAGLRLLPPVPAPRKILCVGLNYGRHVAEAGRELPAHPSMFARFADSFVGHEAPVWKPRLSDKFDYEGELAVVIGRAGRHIAARDALSHVAGYTCMAENSVRDFQKHNAQVTPGKNFERSGAIGPWLVTADEVGDPARLQVITRLNGTVMQQGDVSDLIFPIPELIAYISAFTPLSPGDVIATGTPEGVGSSRKPPRFLAVGDTLEVEIPGIGTLVNTVADEPAPEQGDAHD
jgi:2-keto-4-pentenoate hydratase/2-oxohepta-3-ene-1,7-dioic acid hydratase in catechol pathway